MSPGNSLGNDVNSSRNVPEPGSTPRQPDNTPVAAVLQNQSMSVAPSASAPKEVAGGDTNLTNPVAPVGNDESSNVNAMDDPSVEVDLNLPDTDDDVREYVLMLLLNHFSRQLY